MRKIVVFSTRGQSGQFESDATTWGQIQQQVASIVGDFKDLKITESVNKTNLEHSEAVLPEGDFKIFLRPSKVKSGQVPNEFHSLREYIKENCLEYVRTKAVPNYGKNWTQLSKAELYTLACNHAAETASLDHVKGYCVKSDDTPETVTIRKEFLDLEALREEFRKLEKGF